ncbi:MAG: peptidylprolyl isomerase [Haliscomenobacter sp.]|nr:peptidylprolyl isomerase [Haliscomenobacter sp.]
MALISQIRKHGAWVMVIMIALGVGGFILMDMTVGQTSLFGSAQPTLGKISGTKIKVQQFSNIEALLGSTADPYSRRTSLWNFLVEEILINKEANALGLAISDAELIDLQYDPEPSPIIQQRFADPLTQQLNREQLNGLRQTIDQGTAEAQLKAFWEFQEKEIIKDRLQSKLAALVAKALYVPSWMAEQANREQTQMFSADYVKVPFEAIDNADVALEDADFEAYIKENAELLKTKEERRKIQYVSFDVRPSKADSTALEQELNDLVAEFDTTSNDTSFVERNLGVMDKAFLKKEELSPAFADTLFKLSIGAVFGPYIDGNTYRLTKVLDRNIIPDSVRSRHILLPAQDQVSLSISQGRIDSIKQVIEEGKTTFEAMAAQFGTDGTATKGGDLDYAGMGMMVKPFNDLIFFEAEVGKLYTVITEFGVHLVEVTDKKFINNTQGIRLATISKTILPSEDTRGTRYDEALAFLSKTRTLDALSKEAKKKKLTLETAPPVTANDAVLGPLGPGQQSREIIKWAFSADQGDVSNVIYVYTDPVENYDNRYVIAALQSVQKKGVPAVKDIKADIEPVVINRKKGEMISQRLKGKNLTAASGEFSIPIDTIAGLNFGMTFIPELGNEPKLLGKIATLEQGKTTEPIIGNGGVYVARVILKTNPSALANLPEMRNSLSVGPRAQVSAVLMEAIKNSSKIKDNRAKYF